MKKKELITDFTQGNVLKLMVRFMLPFMATTVLQLVYSLVDMIVVGRFVGPAGLSAVSQGSLIIMFTTMVGVGLTQAGQVLISQLIGVGRREDIGKVTGTLFTLAVIVSVVLTAAIISLRKVLVDAIHIPPEARDMAIQYVLICGSATIFTCGYNAVSSVLRGMGDSRHPFTFILFASVVNIALDLLCTGFLGWGAAGAAAATAASQFTSLALSVRLIVKKKEEFYFDFRLASFRPDRQYTRKLVKLGLPLAIQLSVISLTMIITNAFVNNLGVVASATFAVGAKLEDIAHKLCVGVESASAPIMGQNLGAGKIRRVNTALFYTWGMTFITYALFTLAYFTVGRQMFALFSDDPGVLDLSATFIKAIVWGFPAMIIMRGTHALLQAGGESVLIMIFAFLDSGLRVAICLVCGVAMKLGFFGFVLGYGLAPYGVVIPGLIYYFIGKWKTKELAVNRK